nr:unnamed protein product [Digitaria exilis]
MDYFPCVAAAVIVSFRVDSDVVSLATESPTWATSRPTPTSPRMEWTDACHRAQSREEETGEGRPLAAAARAGGCQEEGPAHVRVELQRLAGADHGGDVLAKGGTQAYDEYGRENFSRTKNGNAADEGGPTLSKLGSNSTAQLYPKDDCEGRLAVMPPASVMTRLILIMVWRKLIRKPNTYSSLIGIIWSLACSWHCSPGSLLVGTNLKRMPWLSGSSWERFFCTLPLFRYSVYLNLVSNYS